MFASLTWPLILGLGATAGFYALIYRGPLHHKLVMRYFAGHPINMIETALFFIGLAALVIKLFELLGEFAVLPSVSLGDSPANQPATAACELLNVLGLLPSPASNYYM